MQYRDTVTLSEHDFGPAIVDQVEEYLRGIGEVERDGNKLTFTVEADDLWDLRERADEVVGYLFSYDIAGPHPDRSKIV